MKKILFLSIFLLIITACSGQDEPVNTPTLDAAMLNETAASRATADFIQTESFIPTQTLPPVYTWTPVPTLDQTRPSYNTPTREKACNIAAAGNPIDVTIPDGTMMTPGQTFTKTWRLENTGRCNWTRQYAVTFFSGNSMQALHNHYLTGEVEPGEMIDISIDMTAPETIGPYQGNWMLIDPQGTLFGIGPNGDAPFWVQIEVVSSITETPQPSPTVTLTPMVYLSDEALLNDQDQLDLDSGNLNPADTTQADFVYQQGGDPAHIFMTMNGTAWMIYGESQPTYADCIKAELVGDAIRYEDIPTGIHVCYKTSDELPGWLMFNSFENWQLSISFLTWAAAGN